jgi:hypothetical protein
MIGLIYKNILVLRKTLLLELAILALILVMMPSDTWHLAIPFGIALMWFLSASMSLGYDEQCNFTRFAFSAPITRRDYVFSKYVPALGLALLSFCSSFMLCCFYANLPTDQSFLSATLFYTLLLVLASVLLPAIFKFGSQKGQIIMVATYLVLFSLLSSYEKIALSILNLIQAVLHMNLFAAGILFLGVSSLALIASAMLSVRIVNQKEY